MSFISILFLPGQSFFKSGYIISLDMDTVYGRIDFRGDRFNSGKCVFIADQGKEPVLFEPGSIYGYRFDDGNYYLSKTVATESGPEDYFMEVLLSGIISLFYCRASSDGYNYYIETREGEMVRLFEKETIIGIPGKGEYLRRFKYYLGSLGSAMSDAPELHSQIERAELKQTSLVKLLQQYHNIVCSDMDCIKYIKSYPGTKVQIAPIISWQTELLKINGFSDYAGLNYQAAYYPSAGLSLVIKIPGNSERFSLRTDISVGKRYFYGFRKEVLNDRTNYMEAHLNHTALTGDMKVNYTSPAGRFRPTCSGGISVQKNIFASHRMEMDIVTPGIIVPLTVYTNDWCGPWFGINASAGFETNLSSQMTVSCMFQYRHLIYSNDKSIIKSIGLTSSLIF